MAVGPVAPAMDPSGSVTLGADGGAQVKFGQNLMAHWNLMNFTCEVEEDALNSNINLKFRNY